MKLQEVLKLYTHPWLKQGHQSQGHLIPELHRPMCVGKTTKAIWAISATDPRVKQLPPLSDYFIRAKLYYQKLTLPGLGHAGMNVIITLVELKAGTDF